MNEPHNKPIADAGVRQQALDPTQSFIVQAPAGSGKTELLTKRFLRLLGRVAQPEEIIALTFTRKAAAEMRARISSALSDAAVGKIPESDNDKERLALAEQALRRDAEYAWQLQANPQRLRVMTIDAFNGALVRQMPLMSRMGGPLATTDQASGHYREAVRRGLLHLEQNDKYRCALSVLLRYFDNRVERVEQQLIAMLARREQWLALIGSTLAVDEPALKKQLEAVLAEQVKARLQALCAATPKGLAQALLPLARFAGEQLYAGKHPSPIEQLADIRAMPGSDWSALGQWQAIAELLLTAKEASVRKTVNVKQGFPAGAGFAGNKQAMRGLLASLAAAPAFVHCLHTVRSLPGRGYPDLRWRVLRALCEVLLLIVAELRVEFAAQGQVDHSENTLRALQALGDDDQPTDLALSLDYRIHHLLVDEFQDTSVAQFGLLERLVRGWQPGDGRSLFLVGDPMQSIYRFRQAEVSLFLSARQRGVGDVALTPLYLTQNFRASAALVAWVNRTFAQVFPATENPTDGTVTFAASTTGHPQAALIDTDVQLHPALNWCQEAQNVIDIIQRCRRDHPQRTIAVLVRSRTHLLALYPLLEAQGIEYQAVGIEKLTQCTVVRDLLALTRALLHPADSIAWLAILRAPWCGLSLADLLALTKEAPASAAILQKWSLECVSKEGGQRLQRFQAVLRPALRWAGRVSWVHLVKSTWLALGGPACVGNGNDGLAQLSAAECFFQQLGIVQASFTTLPLTALQQRLAAQSAPMAVSADAKLQLMTIHKSKGLEFDTVIVPNLGRFGRSDEPLPIRWLQTHDGRLLLAPAKQPDELQADAIYQLIGAMEKEKADNERKRLLYVAVTRAKSQLHLLGHASVKNNSLYCDKRSLLKVIWPQVKAAFVRLSAQLDSPQTDSTQGAVDKQQTQRTPPLLRRLPADWCMPVLHSALANNESDLPSWQLAQEDKPVVEFDWAGLTARHIGTLVHRYLQRIADEGLEHWPVQRITQLQAPIAAELLELGVEKAQCRLSAQRCQWALGNTLNDPRGRWLLSAHTSAASEFALSARDGSQVIRRVIDRTFIDEYDTRWIIDYKIGEHKGSDIAQFLDREKIRYQQQLQDYAQLMQHLEPRPIRLGLYFPLLKGWREW